MPSKGDTQINNFVGGLITEASPLTFPPNASIDEINFKLKRDGSRERRLGLDFEDDYTLHSTGLTAAQIQRSSQTFFHWQTPNGSTEVDIGIVQVGSLLWFIDLFTANPSSNLLNGGSSIDLGLPTDAKLSYATINNQVAVVSASLDVPFLLSYDESTDVVSVVSGAIKIRDLYGVDDGLAAGTRPTTLTVEHEYNLRNQGWNDKIVTVSGAEILQDTFNSIGEYPSNSDTWSLGKIADVTDADIDKYDPETLQKNSFDIGRSARGHFIIDVFNRGASRNDESGLTLSNADRDIGRLSAVESYAGRLFYAGVTSKVVGGDKFSPNLSGTVFYSQIARSNDDLLKCYQEADPTSPVSNDSVDSDGGVIQISGAVDIVKLKTIKTSLFVFASNGVWQIRGDEGGFRSTSLQVNKISSIGVFSPESIVEANGTIFFWAKSGIYSLTPNQIDSTTFDSTNITLTTIQRGYNSLPDLLKQNAKGYYDLDENKVRWLYKMDVDETIVVPDPDPDVVTIGPPIEITSSGHISPMWAKVSASKAILIYRQVSGNLIIKYRIVTVNSDATLTLGAEGTLHTASLNLSSHTITYISDDRVLLGWQESANSFAAVVNISGDTATRSTIQAVNTTGASGYSTSPVRLIPVTATRFLYSYVDSTGNVQGLVTLDIDVADNITVGTKGLGSSTTIARPHAAMLSTGNGVGVAATLSSRVVAETFTITGTTVTFSTVATTFPNATQLPGVSFSQSNPYIVPRNSSSAAVVAITTTTPGTSNYMGSYVINISGTAITSITILNQTSEVGTVPVATEYGTSDMAVLYRQLISGSDYHPRLLINSISGTTPTATSQFDQTTTVTGSNPEILNLSDLYVLSAWEGGVTGTEITAMASKIV